MDVASTDQAQPRWSVRWRWLAAIVAGGAALMSVLQVPGLFPDDALRNLATISAMLLVVGLLALWAVFGTGLGRARKRGAFVLLMAAFAAAVGCLRVEGFSGNLTPRLTWRWAAKPDESLVTGGALDDAAGNLADFRRSTEYDFPQFLGRHRNATVSAPEFGTDWANRPPRLLWRQPIGAGWSSFAVVSDYCVTQEQRGEREYVTCYELRTGKLIWSHSDPGRFSHPMSGDGPRSTPTVDDGRIYTLGALGRLNCLDGRSGKILWTHEIVEENKAELPQWGKSCSPLIFENLVIVSAGGADGRSLVAYDKQSGKMVWHAGDLPSSYSSPRLAHLADTEQVLIVDQTAVVAHDPADGQILWKFDWPGGDPKVADAVAVDEGHVFIAAGYGLGCKLLTIAASDGRLAASAEWESRQLKPKFTNVVIHDDHVFGLDDGKALVCLEWKTGKRRWRGGRYGHGQILLVNDLLIVQAESGEVAAVEASPRRFHELGKFAALDDQTWNNPIVAGRFLLVRNATEAACYQLAAIAKQQP